MDHLTKLSQLKATPLRQPDAEIDGVEYYINSFDATHWHYYRKEQGGLIADKLSEDFAADLAVKYAPPPPKEGVLSTLVLRFTPIDVLPEFIEGMRQAVVPDITVYSYEWDRANRVRLWTDRVTTPQEKQNLVQAFGMNLMDVVDSE